jgi:hypothetical protein
LIQSTASDENIKVVPPFTLVVPIGTKVNITTTGRPRVKISVSKQLSQLATSDEINKVVLQATLVVRIGIKVQTKHFLEPTFLLKFLTKKKKFQTKIDLDQKKIEAKFFWSKSILV